MKLSSKTIATFALTLALTVPTLVDAKSLRLAYDHTNEHPTGKAMIKFSELLKEYTHGNYTVKLYPNGQLGDERKMLEQVQNKLLDGTKTATVLMTTYSDQYAVLVLPYLFESPEHFNKAMNGPVGDKLFTLTQSKGLVGLSFLYDERRSYYTVKKPIQKPSDLNGTKIRVINSADAIELAETMGATPTPISWSEVYTALQQGVVDGAEGGPSALTLYKHGDVAKHFSNSQHVMYPGLIVIGSHIWNKLNDEEKQQFSRAAKEAAAFQMAEFIALEKKAMEDMKTMGVTISEPDLDAFKKQSEPYRVKRLQTPESQALYKEIQSNQ